jgi:hypothetical protein
LKIDDDDRTNTFIVKTENEGLNIYNKWYPAGTTPYPTRSGMTRDEISDPDYLSRWEFIKEPIESDIRVKYLLKSAKGYFRSRNPITYVKC